MDVFLTILDVFLPVDKKNGCKNESVGCIYYSKFPNLHPTKHFWQIYIHCIYAGCKNGNVPGTWVKKISFLLHFERVGAPFVVLL